jgi:hypothetical protein
MSTDFDQVLADMKRDGDDLVARFKRDTKELKERLDAITSAKQRIRVGTDAVRECIRLQMIVKRKAAARHAGTQVRPWWYVDYACSELSGTLAIGAPMSASDEIRASRQIIADFKWRLLHQPRTGFACLTEPRAETLRIAILAERLRLGALIAAETPIHTLTAAE